jgi:Flp pilus assembly protein TadD
VQMRRKIAIGLFLSCLLPLAFAAEESHSAAYYNIRGVTFGRSGDYDNAIENFETAISIDPQYAQAYLNLGIIYRRKDEPDKALMNLEKAAELDPNMPEAYSNLALIYEKKGEREKAYEFSRKALTANQDNPDFIFNLGYTYLLQGETDLARRQYQRLKGMQQEELAEKLLNKIKEKEEAE